MAQEPGNGGSGETIRTKIEAPITTPGSDLAKSNLNEVKAAAKALQQQVVATSNSFAGLLNDPKKVGAVAEIRTEFTKLIKTLKELGVLNASIKVAGLDQKTQEDLGKQILAIEKNTAARRKATREAETLFGQETLAIQKRTRAAEESTGKEILAVQRNTDSRRKAARDAEVTTGSEILAIQKRTRAAEENIGKEILAVDRNTRAKQRAARAQEEATAQEIVSLQKRKDAEDKATRTLEENVAKEILAIQKRKDAEDKNTPEALRAARLQRARTATSDASDPEFVAQRQRQQALSTFSRANNPEGNAALLGVQATLIANYSIINGLMSTVKSSLSFSIELEAAFKNLQAVAGITGKEMVGLQQTILDVAGSTKFSATEVADAALILGQAGLSASQIAESIKPIVLLATAAGTSLQQSVDLVTSIVGVFNVSTSQTADIANKVTQAVNASKLSVDKLSLGLQYAGNTASQLGISFEEVTAAMAAMSNAGIKSGSTMGTGLRQFLVEVQKPSEEFLATIQRLGLTMEDLNFKANGLTGVAKKLRDAGFVASDAIKSFDVRGAAAFNALIANPEDMQRQLEGLYNTQAAVKANETQMEALKNQALRLTSSFQNLVAQGFGPVGNALKVIISGMADLFNSMAKIPGLSELIGISLAGWLSAGIIKYLGGIITGFGTLTKMIQGATVAQQALNLASSANVIGVAISAIIAGYALYTSTVKTAEKTTDELKGSLNEAQASFNAKTEAVKILSAKIDELQSREANLRGDTAALRTEVMSANGIMGQWGNGITNLNTTFDDLISRLKKTRAEVQQMALLNMDDVTGKAGAVRDDAAKNLNQTAAEFRRLQVIDKNPYTLAGTVRVNPLKSLLTNNRSELEAALGKGSSGLTTLQNISSGMTQGRKLSDIEGFSGLPELLRKVLSSGQVKSGTELESRLNSLINDSAKVVSAMATYQAARADYSSKAMSANEAKDYEAFEKRTNFTDRLNPNFSLGTAVQKALPGVSDPLDLAAKGLELYNARKKELDAMEAMVKDMKNVSSPTLNKIKITLAGQRSKLQSDLNSLNDAANPDRDAAAAISTRNDNARLKLLTNQVRNGASPKDAMDQAKAIFVRQQQALFEKEVQKDNLLEGSRRYTNAQQARDENVKLALENFAVTLTAGQGKIAGAAYALDAKQLKAQVDAKVREANELKSEANKFTSRDQILGLAGQGLGKLAEARALDIAALKATQMKEKSTNTIGGKEEMAALKDKWEAISDTYINNFAGMISAAVDNTFNLSRKFKEIKENIEASARRAQEALDKASEPLQQAQLNQAIARGPISGRTVSQARSYLYDREEERARLPVVQQRITNNRDEYGQQINARDSYAASLAAMRNELNSIKSRTSGRDITRESGVDKIKLINDLAAQKALEEAIANTQGQQNDASQRALALQKELYTLKQEEAGLQPAPPPLDSQGEYVDKLKEAWAAYKAELKTFDPATTFGNNTFTFLRSLSDRFGDLFSDIVTGSKTAKQAFSDFASGIIKAMIQILAQALAMQAIKAIMGSFGFTGFSGGGSVGKTSTSDISTMVSAKDGGYIPGRQPTTSRPAMKHYSLGSKVTGGTPGKDSVMAMLMPGEFVLKERVADMLGPDFLNEANKESNYVAKSTQQAIPQKNAETGKPVITNVWIVPKDEMPSMGPNDIIAVISDNIDRGGAVKKLIKQVVTQG